MIELAEKIKEKGQTSAAELPELLRRAEEFAADRSLDVRTRALAYRAAGNARQLLNEFPQALESYNNAALLLETIDDPVELGRTLHAKVGMLFTLSRFDELFECSARARQIFEQSGDRKRLARLDVNLSHAYHRLGRPMQALECSERAVGVLAETDDREGFIAASINSAVTLTAMHEFERAEERYRAALDAATAAGMASWVLLSRYNLAYLRYLNGDTSTALDQLQEIRAEYERANHEWMVCQCWLDESEILLEVGDLDDSINAAGRAGALAVKLGLNAEIAKSLLYEAAARMRLGRSSEAAGLLEEAASRFAVEGDPVSTAVAKLQTAVLRSANGDGAAISDAVSARGLLRDSGLPHRRALAEIVIGRMQRSAGEMDAALDSFRTALEMAERSRSKWMEFHAASELGMSTEAHDPAQSLGMFTRADRLLDSLWDRIGSDDLKMAFLADRDNIYTALVRSAAAESPAAGMEYSEKARSRVLCERLMGGARIAADGLPAKLDADEVVIEYFVSRDDLYIFILDRSGFTCTVRSGVVPRVREECANFERHIESCSVKWEQLAMVRHHLEATAQHHLRSLYDELIAPVSAALRDTVVFVPHGFLHGLPFHALFDGKQYLAERVGVAYTPSAAMYCTAAPAAPAAAPLFIGFSAGPASSSILEIKETAALVPGSAQLLNPSLDQLREALAVPRRLVHIAGHAGVDPIAGRFSWIETPEGRLGSRELSNMHIRAGTVVVTGCRTARRLVQAGDEWQGLMRSFYLSGANTIVSALWDIRDEAALLFATEFYKCFNGQNVLGAVQSAARIVRGRQGHPYFWSGFESFVRKNETDDEL